MPNSRFETAAEINSAIHEIFLNRSALAQTSEYDRGVCIRAVSVARNTFNAVPVAGTAETYIEDVIRALSKILETYRDPDGIYTSGRSSIGDVLSDLRELASTCEAAQSQAKLT